MAKIGQYAKAIAFAKLSEHKDVNKTNNVMCMLESLTEICQDCNNQKAELRSCK